MRDGSFDKLYGYPGNAPIWSRWRKLLEDVPHIPERHLFASEYYDFKLQYSSDCENEPKKPGFFLKRPLNYYNQADWNMMCVGLEDILGIGLLTDYPLIYRVSKRTVRDKVSGLIARYAFVIVFDDEAGISFKIMERGELPQYTGIILETNSLELAMDQWAGIYSQ